jgi:hypothetical protein
VGERERESARARVRESVCVREKAEPKCAPTFAELNLLYLSGYDGVECDGDGQVAGTHDVRAFDARVQSKMLDAYPVTRMLCGASHAVASALVGGTLGERQLAEDAGGLNTYGRGLYLTRYASKAARMCAALGCHELVIVKVALGNTETQTKEDRSRQSTSSGYHSMVVPGRRIPGMPSSSTSRAPAKGDIKGDIFSSTRPQSNSTALGPHYNRVEPGQHSEEFVVFDMSQVLPLYCVGFEMQCKE